MVAMFEKSPPVPLEEFVRIDYRDLMDFVTEVFTRLGASREDAGIVADVLVTADLCGISSHGVQRLKSYYYEKVKSGVIKVDAKLETICEGPSYALLDANHGLGHPAAYKAMKLAIEKARETGIAIVCVRNSSHYGIAGYYALMAAREDMIGISMTNTMPYVAHTGAVGRTIGTNPIAFSAPALSEPPFLLDMATSVVPIGKIQMAVRLRKKIPSGWGIDSEGNLTDDPVKVVKDGALLPLGGLGELLGGHKGYGLSLMVDILCGVLSGSGFGGFIERNTIGHTMMAIDISKFMPVEEFKQRMEKLKNYLKNSRVHPEIGKIWIHGEKSYLTMQTRKKIGVPVHKTVMKEMEEIAEELGIEVEWLK